MFQKFTNKILEGIPGILVWSTLVALFFLSVFQPLWAIYFIIAFDLYWLLRVLYMLLYMIWSWRKYRMVIKNDWIETLQTKFSHQWESYYHLIFYPTYKEPINIIERSLQSIVSCRYPKDKIIIMLTGEERDKENFLNISRTMEAKYKNVFFRFYVNIHPAGIPDELPGKGSNINHAGRQAKRYIDELKIPYENVIVSSFDIDTCPHPDYFAYLTYTFLSTPQPTYASYQPIAIYNNNIWESHPLIRVVASSTTFWLLTDLSRPERLFTFSSHSMSFRALVDVGFWDKTIVTEDSRIFLQCFVHYNGNYRVIPLYMPVYMNTVDVGNTKRSLINQYKQIRRWAWGVEHFPWMFKEFFLSSKKGIPFIKKLRYLWNQTEGVYSWASAPLVIFMVGHLPLWLATESEKQTSLFQNAPTTLSALLRISMISLMIITCMYSIMLPPKPKTYPWYNYIFMVLQWVLAPFTLILFGALPAVDATTRLMLGGRFKLGFWVTEKK